MTDVPHSAEWDEMNPDERDALICRVTDAAMALVDPAHPRHAETLAFVRRVEASIWEQTSSVRAAIDATECLSAADYGTVINAGLDSLYLS